MPLLFPTIPAAPVAACPPEDRVEALRRLRAACGRPLPAMGSPARGVLAVLGGAVSSDFVLRIFQARPGPGGSVRLMHDIELTGAEPSLSLPFGLSPLAWILHRLLLVAWTGPFSAPALLAVGSLGEIDLPSAVLARFRLDHAEIRDATPATLSDAGALLVRRGDRILLRAPAAEGLLSGDLSLLRFLVRDYRRPAPPSAAKQSGLFADL